jgi:hypothetical protein
MALYVYEFFYRGRAPGSAEPPAWHLILASDAKDEFGRTPPPGLAMSMAQAKAAGWGLPEIVKAINADLLAEAEALRAARAAGEAEFETEKRRADELTMVCERQAGEIEAMRAQTAALELRLAEASAVAALESRLADIERRLAARD